MTHEPDPGDSPPARRRLEDPSAKAKEGRGGCLITGAVLGIIVGATFAFYGLPPILRHYYGEQKVAAGEAYEGDAKYIRVEGVHTAPGEPRVVVVTLTVRSNKTWTVQRSDWKLEVEGVDKWIPAEESEAPVTFDLGVVGHPVLRFRLPEDARGELEALHLATPRVRFELPPLAAP